MSDFTWAPENNQRYMRKEKTVIRADHNWTSFLHRLRGLDDGRYMLTITKSNDAIDLTVLNLGRVEEMT